MISGWLEIGVKRYKEAGVSACERDGAGELDTVCGEGITASASFISNQKKKKKKNGMPGPVCQ